MRERKRRNGQRLTQKSHTKKYRTKITTTRSISIRKVKKKKRNTKRKQERKTTRCVELYELHPYTCVLHIYVND